MDMNFNKSLEHFSNDVQSINDFDVRKMFEQINEAILNFENDNQIDFA